MDDAIDGSKELMSETVRAFKTGLRGEEYTPGAGNPEIQREQEELIKLAGLRDAGTLTEEEYTAAKLRLLSGESAK